MLSCSDFDRNTRVERERNIHLKDSPAITRLLPQTGVPPLLPVWLFDPCHQQEQFHHTCIIPSMISACCLPALYSPPFDTSSFSNKKMHTCLSHCRQEKNRSMGPIKMTAENFSKK